MQHFETSDGLSLTFYRWGTPGSSLPLFLHHGFGVNAAINWEMPGIVAALVAAGHDVIAIDARGHGTSDAPVDSAYYGEARMARDLSELIDHLGYDAVMLAGYSMGAVVSLIAASQDARIRQLIVGGVGSGIVETGGVDTRAVSGEAIAAALLAEDAASVTGPAQPFREMADMIGSNRAALATHALVVHAQPIDLAAIRVPVLVIAGDDDPLAASPEMLVAALPDARLCLLPGDHRSVPVLPAFAQAMVAFLPL